MNWDMVGRGAPFLVSPVDEVSEELGIVQKPGRSSRADERRVFSI